MHELMIVAQLMFFPPSGPLPQTMTIVDGDKKLGTATINPGSITVYRDANGELAGSSGFDKDGVRRFYDPHGKPIENNPLIK